MGVFVMGEEDMLILKARARMRHEDMEKEKEWFEKKMGLKVKIIDDMYEIAGVEEKSG